MCHFHICPLKISHSLFYRLAQSFFVQSAETENPVEDSRLKGWWSHWTEFLPHFV